MRTTITLDDDVAARIREEMRASGRSFKQAVNHLLRRALDVRPAAAPRRFVVEARPLGLRPGLSYDDVEGLLDLLEGERRT